MSTAPAYLPGSLVDQLRLEVKKLSGDDQWKIARLTERAFAEGYQIGYARGYDSGWDSARSEARADGDDQ